VYRNRVAECGGGVLQIKGGCRSDGKYPVKGWGVKPRGMGVT